jgi:hypothetical protein
MYVYGDSRKKLRVGNKLVTRAIFPRIAIIEHNAQLNLNTPVSTPNNILYCVYPIANMPKRSLQVFKDPLAKRTRRQKARFSTPLECIVL